MKLFFLMIVLFAQLPSAFAATECIVFQVNEEKAKAAGFQPNDFTNYAADELADRKLERRDIRAVLDRYSRTAGKPAGVEIGGCAEIESDGNEYHLEIYRLTDVNQLFLHGRSICNYSSADPTSHMVCAQ